MSARRRDSEDEKIAVPLFGSWRNAYITIVAFFAFDVAAFYFFGRYFS